MKQAIKKFEKAKDFLICIDSDGCVLDTMDVKHMRCLGRAWYTNGIWRNTKMRLSDCGER